MRLLTRSDFDGLACAALLKDLGIIDHWKFVHPKDIQDGLVKATDQDVCANIPYIPGCKLWFDHHSSEEERLGRDFTFEGESRAADSAARVIYEYYGGKEKLPYMEEMVIAVDRVDSGKLTKEDVMNPKDWVLLGYIMDPRTGLGRFRDFRISNYQLMEKLIDGVAKLPIDDILKDEDVAERVLMYYEQNTHFKDMIETHTKVDANVIITDLRGVSPIYTGNRFLIYSMYPEQNISMWVVDGRRIEKEDGSFTQNCPISVGHSILNRTAKTDVGSMLLKYGGGGHEQVGTCQVAYEEADKVIAALLEQMKQDNMA